jgi:ABC-type uncharacterized transport system auxiliary subunit
MRAIIVSIAAMLLASCSVTTPRDVGNANKITLNTVTLPASKAPAKYNSIQIEYPTASTELDTYRIAVTKTDGMDGYFEGTRWNEFLPAVVQAAIIESLSRNSAFAFVQSDEDNTRSNYVLHTAIEDFRAVYSTSAKPPIISMRLAFHVTSKLNSKRVKRFVISKAVPAKDNSLSSVTEAFNSAFHDLINDLAKKL